MGYQDISTLRT